MRGVLDEVERVDEAGQPGDAGLRRDDVLVRPARGQDDDVVAAAVADDEQLAVERAAEGVAAVLDDAVGRVVVAEVEGGAAPVAVGLRADGVLAVTSAGSVPGGRVAAVEDVLAARRVGVAVVAAADDAEEVVALRHRRR